MPRMICLLATAVAFATAVAAAQDLRLDDRDLAPYENEPEGLPPSVEEGLPPLPRPTRNEARDALSEPYDTLIDRLNEDARRIRIELRERPARVAQARHRLESLLAAEKELRREAYQRVVYRHPHPIFEDFDDAVEEALERREVREALRAEIAENEREIAELEAELEAVRADLDEALRLKTEALDEFNRTAPSGNGP